MGLRADKEFVLAAVATNVQALHFASAELKADKQFMLVIHTEAATKAEAEKMVNLETEREGARDPEVTAEPATGPEPVQLWPITSNLEGASARAM